MSLKIGDRVLMLDRLHLGVGVVQMIQNNWHGVTVQFNYTKPTYSNLWVSPRHNIMLATTLFSLFYEV